jgi:ABC-type branched-subunit amino acid transport system substrate-binding protein
LVGGQIAQFYKQKEELGVDIDTFGTDLFESPAELKAAQGLMDGVVYPNYDISDEFWDRYVDTFNSNSQVTWAGNGYDLTTLLIEEVDYTSPESIIESFKYIDGFRGVHGRYEYREDPDGDNYLAMPVVLKKIQNGEFVEA